VLLALGWQSTVNRQRDEPLDRDHFKAYKDRHGHQAGTS
jgi:hypothetical protein